MRKHRVHTTLPQAAVHPSVKKHLAAAASTRDLINLFPREHRVRLDANLMVGKGARKLALRSKLPYDVALTVGLVLALRDV